MTASIVAEWPKKPGETVRVALGDFNGHPTVEIRIWWEDGEGVWRAGKAGITIGRAHLQRLADALARAVEMDREGSRHA